MKVYVDLVFFINFMFDLLLLLVTGIERHTLPSFKRFLLGAFLGSLSIVFLFLPLSSLLLFLLKALVSIAMILGTFGYRNKTYFLENIKSLYGSSIILGGLMYFLNVQCSYRQEGFIFVHDGTSINLIIIMITSPILFYLYFKQRKEQRKKLQLLYQVKMKYKGKTLSFQGCLDTGNTIVDPYHKRPVLIVSKDILSPPIEEAILVPFKSVGEQSLLRCIALEELWINDKKMDQKNYLVGSSKETINLHGASCILPSCLIEEENI